MGNTRTPKSRPSKLPKLIDQYYADLAELAHQQVMHEMGTRPPFHALLAAAARPHGWTLIAEHEKKINGKSIRPDDPQYITRLVGQVIRVSLETMQIVNALPGEFSDADRSSK
jgi:hypothetical protein